MLSSGPPPLSPNLSEENLRELAAARRAFRTVGRAVRMAKMDGWTLVFIGALTVMFDMSSWASVALGALLAFIGCVELLGAWRINKLDPEAAKLLGFNQIFLGALLILYAVWQMHGIRTGDLVKGLGGGDPEMQSLMDSSADVLSESLMILYYGMIAVAIFGMGSMALYYFTRRRHIIEYRDNTPEWILAIKKSGL